MNNKKTLPRKKAPVNWDDIRRRIEKNMEAAEHGFKPSADTEKAILKARAQALAAAVEAGREEESIAVVEFSLAGERYALESGYVREVVPLVHLTPVPCVPRFVIGIINLHGEILSVIDIKRFFDIPDRGLTDLNKVIVLNSKDMEFGVLADYVFGARIIPLKDIQRSLPTLTGIREEYLKGVTEERIVVLDAGKLLTDKNILVNDGAV